MFKYRLYIWIVLLFYGLLHSAAGAQATIETRFAPPAGFERVPVPENSFAAYLRRLPLLPEGTPVIDYRGRILKKGRDSTVAAIVDMDMRGRKLEQCMDVLLRLYSSYLREAGQESQIAFPLPDGLQLSWMDWQKGFRPQFKGLHFLLIKGGVPDTSAQNFQTYLNTVYELSGSQTFYHFYPAVPLQNMRIGDFITRSQRRGHAVIVVDMAENAGGEIRIMVGQGDTPACPLYILKNKNGSPWFRVDSTRAFPALPIHKKMFWKGLRRFGTPNPSLRGAKATKQSPK